MAAWRRMLVLVAGCYAGLSAAAVHAQPSSEPLPVQAGAPYGMNTPGGAPPGYCPSPALPPPDLSQALQEAPARPCGWQALGADAEGWYTNVGAMGLRRPAFPHAPVALLDAGFNTTVTQTVNVPVTYQTTAGQGPILGAQVPVMVTSTLTSYADTGNAAPAGAAAFGDYHDVSPGLDWGFRLALGQRDDDFAFEFGGFCLFTHGSSSLISSAAVGGQSQVSVVSVGAITVPGNPTASILSVGSVADAVAQANPPPGVARLDVPFFNAPAGFGGDNGLFAQADQVVIGFQSSLGDFEFTTRHWLIENDHFQFQVLGGPRYVNLNEKLGILTQDDVLAAGPTPLADALYAVKTENNLLLAQLGFEAEGHLGKFLSLNGFVKGAWGVNFLDSEVSLTRGDGLIGFDQSRHSSQFAHLYEVGLFGQVCLSPHVRLKAGYEGMWILNVAKAFDQLDYDLSQVNGNRSDNGSVFFSGPVIEMQIHF